MQVPPARLASAVRKLARRRLGKVILLNAAVYAAATAGFGVRGCFTTYAIKLGERHEGLNYCERAVRSGDQLVIDYRVSIATPTGTGRYRWSLGEREVLRWSVVDLRRAKWDSLDRLSKPPQYLDMKTIYRTRKPMANGTVIRAEDVGLPTPVDTAIESGPRPETPEPPYEEIPLLRPLARWLDEKNVVAEIRATVGSSPLSIYCGALNYYGRAMSVFFGGDATPVLVISQPPDAPGEIRFALIGIEERSYRTAWGTAVRILAIPLAIVADVATLPVQLLVLLLWLLLYLAPHLFYFTPR